MYLRKLTSARCKGAPGVQIVERQPRHANVVIHRRPNAAHQVGCPILVLRSRQKLSGCPVFPT